MCRLNKADKGRFYTVVSVPDVSMLQALGIRKNDVIYKKHSYLFGGPTLLEIDAREVAIGNQIAALIDVEEREFIGQLS